MVDTFITQCEQCGKVNEIDARYGGTCEACGHLILPKQSSPQKPTTNVPAAIEIKLGEYGSVTQVTRKSSGCVGILMSSIVLSILGIAIAFVFIAESVSSVLEQVGEQLGISTANVPQLQMALLVESEFGGVDGLALSPNGQLLAYSDDDGIHIYDLETNRVRGTISSDFMARDLGFNADSTRLFADSNDLIIYDVDTLQAIETYDDHIVTSFQSNLAGTYAAIRISPEQSAHVLDLTTLELVYDLPQISDLGLPSIDISPNGDYAFIVHTDAYRLIDLKRERDILLGFNKVNSGRWAGEEDVLYVSADGGVHRVRVVDGVAQVEQVYKIPSSIYSLSNEPIAVSYTGDSMALILTGLTEFYRYSAENEKAQATGKTESFIRQMVITEDFVITADTYGNIQRWD
ncbi:MAG: hypothetical protein CUN55_09000 [Phototrophicales bacterium]|nr:MAG: hypothetical protein CUN55_09000 [Phototrophicales bacterium]